MTHGAGWVERIVVDQPDVSSFFTPLSICLNVDSWEHLEFETRADQLLSYTLVQGDERVVLEFSPMVHGGEDGRCSRRCASSRCRNTSRWSCRSRTTRTSPDEPDDQAEDPDRAAPDPASPERPV